MVRIETGEFTITRRASCIDQADTSLGRAGIHSQSDTNPPLQDPPPGRCGEGQPTARQPEHETRSSPPNQIFEIVNEVHRH